LSILVAVLLIGLGVSVFSSLARIRSQVQSRLSNELQTVLETTNKAVQSWVDDEKRDATALASRDELRLSVEQQLRIGRDVERLRASAPLKRIRNLLDPALKIYRLPGFVIIAPDGDQIAAHLDDEVGLREVVDSDP